MTERAKPSADEQGTGTDPQPAERAAEGQPEALREPVEGGQQVDVPTDPTDVGSVLDQP